MAEKRHYPRAPITEAVIEIRFDDPMSARDMEWVTDTSHWPSRKRRLFVCTFRLAWSEVGTAAAHSRPFNTATYSEFTKLLF